MSFKNILRRARRKRLKNCMTKYKKGTLFHFSVFVDDKITVIELGEQVVDIVVPDIEFRIDSFYTSINGKEN